MEWEKSLNRKNLSTKQYVVTKNSARANKKRA